MDSGCSLKLLGCAYEVFFYKQTYSYVGFLRVWGYIAGCCLVEDVLGRYLVVSIVMVVTMRQKPEPTNATGVPIAISVVDSNGNYRLIGTTASDASGTSSFTWTPDISGDFTVIANFISSMSYYPSSDETHFTDSEVAGTPGPTSTTQTGMATTADLLTYLAVGFIAVIIMIVVATL